MSTTNSIHIAKDKPPAARARIQINTNRNLAYYASLDRAAVDRRLQELDREWDVERILETHAGGIILGSFVLGAVSNRKWFALSGVVGSFLLQHAIQGWCAPMAIVRRLGFRTVEEIEAERQELLQARTPANN